MPNAPLSTALSHLGRESTSSPSSESRRQSRVDRAARAARKPIARLERSSNAWRACASPKRSHSHGSPLATRISSPARSSMEPWAQVYRFLAHLAQNHCREAKWTKSSSSTMNRCLMLVLTVLSPLTLGGTCTRARPCRARSTCNYRCRALRGGTCGCQSSEVLLLNASTSRHPRASASRPIIPPFGRPRARGGAGSSSQRPGSTRVSCPACEVRRPRRTWLCTSR